VLTNERKAADGLFDNHKEVEKQDGQIAHGTILTSWRNPRNAKELGIRHSQAFTKDL
jgi:hypothetical protein